MMKAKILVIDDEESIRFTFNEFLTEEGHEVFCSDNFDDAVRIIETEGPDLIFLDIILGERNGIDILKKVNNSGLLCPVIMITGQPDISTAADSVRLGAFDYLSKPVHQETLLRVTQIALIHRDVVTEKENYRKHLDAVFQSVTDAIISIDRGMRFMAANAAVESICGIKPSELIGRHFDSIHNASINACREVLEKTLIEGKIIKNYSIECTLSNKPKQIIKINSSPLMERNGKSLGAILVIRDVTRIFEMESELKNRHSFQNIAGKSKQMRDIFDIIENLTDIQTTVLITGESGTGKELIARALHYSGPRAFKPMVTVNCATLVENLLESELFGHVRGAFTGAIRDKVGKFQEADGGSIFLDEIGEVSPVIQLKLLRVLQEKEFERVGDSTPIHTDARIIAATNRHLDEDVKNGVFREDLYYRLKVVEIKVPPLRKRMEDIPLLIDHFCSLFNERFHKQIRGVTSEVMETFLHYSWPGNVRELEHAIERAFVFCRENTIALDHIPPEISESKDETRGIHSKNNTYHEADRILQTLQKTDWNRAKSARLLGISRKTLYKKIHKYNLYNNNYNK